MTHDSRHHFFSYQGCSRTYLKNGGSLKRIFEIGAKQILRGTSIQPSLFK